MSSINLLPWRETQIIYKNRIFIASCMFVAIIALIILLFWWTTFRISLSREQSDVNLLSREISNLNFKLAQVIKLEKERDDFLDKIKIVNVLQAQRSETVDLLNNLVKAVPSGLFLIKVSRTGNKFALEGVAESNSRISLLMRNLENYNTFNDAVLIEISKLKEIDGVAQGLKFSLDVNITTKNTKAAK